MNKTEPFWILLPTPRRDGVGRMVEDLFSGLSCGQDLGLIPEIVAVEPAPGETTVAAPHSLLSVTRFSPGALVRAVLALRRRQPALVHTHLFRPAFIAWWARRWGSRFRWLHTEHNMGPRRGWSSSRPGRWAHARAQRAADRLVGVAPAVSLRLKGHLLGSGAKISTVVNGVSGPPELLPLPPAEGAAIRCGFLGRLVPEKGLELLFQALDRTAPAAALDIQIAGAGPLERWVETRCRDAVAAGRSCRFLGGVPEAGPFLRQIDLLLLPSRTEGMPRVLLEAMAHGRPVVAAAVGGVPDALGEGEGWLFPSGDADALAARMMELSGAREELARRGAAARRRWAQHFTLDRMVDGYLQLYRELLGGADSAKPNSRTR